MIVGGKDVGDRPLILAPMEEVTNPPFRKFCKRYGADWLYSEFVSADALVRSINKTVKKLTIEENERPVTIQIYGRFIDSMVEAATGSSQRSWGGNAPGCTFDGGDGQTDRAGRENSGDGKDSFGMGLREYYY